VHVCISPLTSQQCINFRWPETVYWLQFVNGWRVSFSRLQSHLWWYWQIEDVVTLLCYSTQSLWDLYRM
jgi:hypothetical protein